MFPVKKEIISVGLQQIMYTIFEVDVYILNISLMFSGKFETTASKFDEKLLMKGILDSDNVSNPFATGHTPVCSRKF